MERQLEKLKTIIYKHLYSCSNCHGMTVGCWKCKDKGYIFPFEDGVIVQCKYTDYHTSEGGSMVANHNLTYEKGIILGDYVVSEGCGMFSDLEVTKKDFNGCDTFTDDEDNEEPVEFELLPKPITREQILTLLPYHWTMKSDAYEKFEFVNFENFGTDKFKNEYIIVSGPMDDWHERSINKLIELLQNA